MSNRNHVVTDQFSNKNSETRYASLWDNEPAVREMYESGFQCGSCSFYAVFDNDWGLCCNSGSRHHLETVFEHFSCPSQVNEGWDSHSFIDLTDATAEMKMLFESRVTIPDFIYEKIRTKAMQTNKIPYEVIVEVLLREVRDKN